MPAKLLTYGDRGERVKTLQRLINDNPFFKPRRKLVVDGDMRTLTCGAVQQAKYRLGYPRKDIRPVAGQPVFDYLSGKRKLPDAYRARRKARLVKVAAAQHVQSAQTKMRLEALAAVKDELGTMEAPNHSNHIKYNDWWGWGAVAYCVIGISWAWVVKAGSTAFAQGSRWAGTDLMLSDAKAGGHGIHLTSDPDPGCPGVIDFDGHSDPDHAITFVHDNGNGTCTTYEFNTAKDGTYIEGVWVKDRPLRNCWWFEVER